MDAVSENKPSIKIYLLIVLMILIAQALVLLALGRVMSCTCGYVKLWEGMVNSPGNSQHLTDWYTFSHVIHGFGFYLLFWAVGRGRNWPVWKRLVMAVALEASWEVFENTSFIINHYRSETISLDYYGDSVINSLADTAAMAIGFLLAWRLPTWLIILLMIGMESFVVYHIRDNLILNIIMLLFPSESIRQWQMGG